MGVLRGTVEEKELSGTVVSSARSSLLKMKLLASVVVAVVMAGCVSGMDVGKGGVYDSPMAQDYYVKRVRLHVRCGQKWHVRPEGFAGGRPGGSEEGGQACCADEEQRGHLLQERPSNLLLLLHLQQAQEQALAESQAHGEAGTQEDGQHLLQHLHGRPLTSVAPHLTLPH